MKISSNFELEFQMALSSNVIKFKFEPHFNYLPFEMKYPHPMDMDTRFELGSDTPSLPEDCIREIECM